MTFAGLVGISSGEQRRQPVEGRRVRWRHPEDAHRHDRPVFVQFELFDELRERTRCRILLGQRQHLEFGLRVRARCRSSHAASNSDSIGDDDAANTRVSSPVLNCPSSAAARSRPPLGPGVPVGPWSLCVAPLWRPSGFLAAAFLAGGLLAALARLLRRRRLRRGLSRRRPSSGTRRGRAGRRPASRPTCRHRVGALRRSGPKVFPRSSRRPKSAGRQQHQRFRGSSWWNCARRSFRRCGSRSARSVSPPPSPSGTAPS